MKKSVSVFSLLMSGALLFSSCTKNLKDDIKDLQRDLSELKNIIGSDEPIRITTTFVDDNDSTRKITDTYNFKSSNSSTQYMYDNGNGTYEVYIERFSDVDWDEEAYIEFTYNPVTKAITNKSLGHYWDDFDPYGDGAYYSDSYTPAPVLDITINSINMATGDISLSISASGNAAYTTAYSWAAPNPGDLVSTNLTFAGRLKIFSSH